MSGHIKAFDLAARAADLRAARRDDLTYRRITSTLCQGCLHGAGHCRGMKQNCCCICTEKGFWDKPAA